MEGVESVLSVLHIIVWRLSYYEHCCSYYVLWYQLASDTTNTAFVRVRFLFFHLKFGGVRSGFVQVARGVKEGMTRQRGVYFGGNLVVIPLALCESIASWTSRGCA